MNSKHFKDSPAGEASKISLKKYYAGKKATQEENTDFVTHNYDSEPIYGGRTHKVVADEARENFEKKEAAEEALEKQEQKRKETAAADKADKKAARAKKAESKEEEE